jgi:hypothetical protein
MARIGAKTPQLLWENDIVAKNDVPTGWIWHGFLAGSDITLSRDPANRHPLHLDEAIGDALRTCRGCPRRAVASAGAVKIERLPKGSAEDGDERSSRRVSERLGPGRRSGKFSPHRLPPRQPGVYRLVGLGLLLFGLMLVSAPVLPTWKFVQVGDRRRTLCVGRSRVRIDWLARCGSRDTK